MHIKNVTSELDANNCNKTIWLLPPQHILADLYTVWGSWLTWMHHIRWRLSPAQLLQTVDHPLPLVLTLPIVLPCLAFCLFYSETQFA